MDAVSAPGSLPNNMANPRQRKQRPSRAQPPAARRTDSDQTPAPTAQVRIETTWTGAIPQPDDFKRYDDAVPGTGARLVAMVEYEQRTTRRQINGAILIALAVMCVAALSVWTGSPYAAIPIGLIGVIAGIGKVAIEKLLNGRRTN